MKPFLLLLLFCFVQNGYSQSFNYEKYYNQMLQKAEKLGNEMKEEWKRSTQFATRPTNQEIYVLYINGKRVACFSDEFGCNGQIRIFKRKLESLRESAVSGLPSNVSKSDVAQFRNGANNVINNINCNCKREHNPNYNSSTSVYGNNNDWLDFSKNEDFPKNENNNANDQSNILYDGNTQYDNFLDVWEAPSSRDVTVGTNENQPSVTLNFDDMYRYGNSQTPINKNPHDLTVNMDIQKQPDAPGELSNEWIEADRKEREKLAQQKREQSEKVLEEIKTKMTDDQYLSLRAYWYSKTGTEPYFVESKNGTYIFRDDNALYEVTPNKFFTPFVSIKKTYMEGNTESNNYVYEPSLAVITTGGKIVSLKKNVELIADNALKVESTKSQTEISGSRQVSYSSGIYAETTDDGKVRFSMIEAHIEAKGSVESSAGYAATDKELSLSIPVLFDFKGKKEDDGISADISVGPATGGATITNNKKSIHAGVGVVDFVSVVGEIGYKKVDCTSIVESDSKAEVRYLKSAIKSSEEKLSMIMTAKKTGANNLIDIEQEEQNEQKKIKIYNQRVKEIEETSSTQGIWAD